MRETLLRIRGDPPDSRWVKKKRIKTSKSRIKPSKPVVGWREWVALPELGLDAVKVKIDTGARTSSLHAIRIRTIHRDGIEWVSFDVHPVQRNSRMTVRVTWPLLERRAVRSSSGHESVRPVILTDATLLGQRWPIELTLVSRAEMGFRMLLGREALRGRFVVDPGRSFFGERPPGRIREPRRKKTS